MYVTLQLATLVCGPVYTFLGLRRDAGTGTYVLPPILFAGWFNLA